ncbi:hypothetical protein [Porticoccus hydrocarbonoclasticus]|jgi:hypothetical protein|uniref:hypothetical protein n=1 Tax=Porticoccus hydrocarbonoclasticus TaxID=1073414 RepID=UPI002354711B|nr:hypothetical protein [Porticoccus hydrocarbonoclasticus]
MQTERRILIALDALSITEASLLSLVTMARWLNASLAGLYIEDSRLLAAAGLPFAREISSLSGEERLFGRDAMIRSSRMASSRAQQLLEQLSSQQKVACTFHIESGMLAPCALSHEGYDIFFPGRIRTSARPRPPGLSSRPSKPLVLVYDTSPQFYRALEVVSRLAANGMVSDVTLLSETALPPEIADQLPVDGIRVHFQRVESIHPGDLTYLRLPAGSLIMMSKMNFEKLSATELADLPDLLPYPLMLIA